MMSAVLDSVDLYSSKSTSSTRSPGCCNMVSDPKDLDTIHASSRPLTTRQDSSNSMSPTTPPGRVGFSLESDSVLVDNKERERYLTAKYPKHQMGLIRKRLAVEDWVDTELKRLFNISDEDCETYDTIIDLDELLNLDTDSQRSQYIQQKIAHAPKSTSSLEKFTEELLKKANTL